MHAHSLRFAALLAASGLLGAETAQPPRTGLSGAWQLMEQTSEDPAAKLEKPQPAEGIGAARGGGREHAGRGGSGSVGVTMDGPLEALGDAHRLVIADDGTWLQISYPAGRKRVFRTDGEERELDDGDGPAKVVAKRRGAPERVIISSSWSAGRGLKETWELSPASRRLVVAGKVDGRHSFAYRRVYEPAPDLPPAPTAATVPTAATPPAATASAAPSAPAVRPECSLRPSSGARPSELARLPKISLAEAQRRAVASVAPQRVSSVMSSDPEVNEGCLVWPLDLRIEGKSGVLEVLIDAGDGKVLSSTFENSN